MRFWRLPTSFNHGHAPGNNFLKECQDGSLDGVVAIYRTSLSGSITGLIDEELLHVLPKTLKYIYHNGPSPFQRHSILVERKSCVTDFLLRRQLGSDTSLLAGRAPFTSPVSLPRLITLRLIRPSFLCSAPSAVSTHP